MSRLTHSRGGYIRYMQMSRSQIFVFVEGKTNDPYFYGKICHSVLRARGIIYQVCGAQELPGSTGGKEALISFFHYLRRRSKLIDKFRGKVTGSIFFLDKDIDDLLRKKLRSDHVVYTKYYDVENHIFVEGDLAEAAAAAASMDSQFVKRGIGDYENWRRRVAEQWKEWVKFCILARKRNLRCECNYGVRSRINTPPNGPIDKSLHRKYLKILETASGLTGRQFLVALERISRAVDNRYSRGEYNSVFKGKWYPVFLDAEIRRIAGPLPINSNGLLDRLVSGVSLTLDFEKPWADHFKVPMRTLADKL